MNIKDRICDSCESFLPCADIRSYKYENFDGANYVGLKEYSLCNLCAAFNVGRYILSGTTLTRNDIAKHISCVGNEILKAIKELKEGVK